MNTEKRTFKFQAALLCSVILYCASGVVQADVGAPERKFQELNIKARAAAGEPMVLIVGDSVTNNMRMKALSADGDGDSVCGSRIVVAGVSGARTEESSDRLQRYLSYGQGLISAVHVQIGVNDTLHGDVDLEHLRGIYTWMKVLTDRYNAHLVIYGLTPVNWNSENGDVKRSHATYDAINAMIEQMAAELGVEFVDITSIMESSFPTTMGLVHDGVHLSRLGAEAMLGAHMDKFSELCI